MKKAALILCALLCLAAASCLAEAAPRNAVIIINGDFYNGTPFLRDENGQWYVPLAEVSLLTGMEEPLLEDGHIDWGGFWMESTSSDFIFRDDTVYASALLLEDAGMKVKETSLYGADVIAIENRESLDYGWASSRFIAHAMGGVDGASYTNSLEAFNENYMKGFTVFEIDLSMSADGVPVLVHEWAEYKASVQNGNPDAAVIEFPTAEQFRTQKLLGEYTPLTFEDVVNLMVLHPDITVITDMKTKDEITVTQMFSAVVDIARRVDPSVLDRIVPQVYRNEMIGWLNALYPWKSMVYTFYMLPSDTTKADAFLYGYSKGIRAFTMEKSSFDMLALGLAQALDCKVYLHTVNDWKTFNYETDTLHSWGIYTDFLDPLMMDGVETRKEEAAAQ